MISTKPPTLDHIGDIFKIPLRSKYYVSIFSNNEKMENPSHSVQHFYVLQYHQTQKYSIQGYILS